jgi:hypothetical protein
MISLICTHCSAEFKRSTKQYTRDTKLNRFGSFCSRDCNFDYRKSRANNIQQVICLQCNVSFIKTKTELKRNPNSFCSKSCAATFNNKFKRKSRRSKCEIMLFELLKEKFPNLGIIPNDKTMLNGLEVDIAIPSLKLAIEWNGIVHFKPIYGDEKLNTIQSIDNKKLQLANQLEINLIVIPDLVSTKQYVLQVFEYITTIIHNLISVRQDSNL